MMILEAQENALFSIFIDKRIYKRYIQYISYISVIFVMGIYKG